MAVLAGYMYLASNTADTFTTSLDSDILLYTDSATQRIMMGNTKNVPPAFTITSNVTFFGSNNLGIGLSNPAYTLDVSNTIRLNSTLTSNNKLLVLYDGNSNDAVSTACNFYGFGMNSNSLRYQVPGLSSHRFYSGNNLSMTLIASGYLGIGTSNPGSLLTCAGGSSIGAAYSNVAAPANGLIVQSMIGIGTSNPGSMLSCAGAVSVGTAYSNISTPLNSLIVQGAIGVGLSNPSAPVHVLQTVNPSTMFLDSGGATARTSLQTWDYGANTFMANIGVNSGWDANGSNVLWNSNSIGWSILMGNHTDTFVIYRGTDSNVGVNLLTVGDTGNMSIPGSLAQSSDRTLKRGLKRFEDSLEKIKKINGYTFCRNDDLNKRYGGLIAQEVRDIFPELISVDKNDKLLLDYGGMSALYVESIKALIYENESLKKRLDVLEESLKKIV